MQAHMLTSTYTYMYMRLQVLVNCFPHSADLLPKRKPFVPTNNRRVCVPFPAQEQPVYQFLTVHARNNMQAILAHVHTSNTECNYLNMLFVGLDTSLLDKVVADGLSITLSNGVEIGSVELLPEDIKALSDDVSSPKERRLGEKVSCCVVEQYCSCMCVLHDLCGE